MILVTLNIAALVTSEQSSRLAESGISQEVSHLS